MKKVLSLVLAMLMVVSVVAGCTTLEKDPSDPEGKKYDKGAIIDMYLTTEIYNFDPQLSITDDAQLKIFRLIYEGLTTIDENGKWHAKTQKEYLCKRGDEEHGFTAYEFKTAQADGWEKQYPYFVGKKKVYLPPSQAEAQGYERVSKYPKSTRYGRQNPISECWNSEEQLQIWRKKWANIANKHLALAKSESRIDHRSHKARAELNAKISERKQKQTEKANTPPIKIFRHRELTQSIHELSEQIEELYTKKNTILANLNTNDIRTVKTKISDIQKAVPVMDRHANESKTKLDNAQKEYSELKEQAQEFDTEELQNLRYDIRPQIETEIISELRKIYSGSFIQNIYDTAKSETDQSIGETGKRSIREHLRTKKQPQRPNAKNKSKHHEQER